MPVEAAVADGSAEITTDSVPCPICAGENGAEIAAARRNVTGAGKNVGKSAEKKEERKEKEEKLPVTAAATMAVQEPAETMKMSESHAAIIPEIPEITVPWIADIRGSSKTC